MDDTFLFHHWICYNLIGCWSLQRLWSWHFRVLTWSFLTLDTQTWHNAINDLHIVGIKSNNTRIMLLNKNCVVVIAFFRESCLILQTVNCRGNEKYVLVLVQCHNRIITSLMNVFLHLVCKLWQSTKMMDLIHNYSIMALDSNHEEIWRNMKRKRWPYAQRTLHDMTRQPPTRKSCKVLGSTTRRDMTRQKSGLVADI